MTFLRFMLFDIAIAIAAVAYISSVGNEYGLTSHTLARAIGGVVGLAIIPILLSAPLWILQRRRKSMNYAPSFVGGVLVLLISGSAIYDARNGNLNDKVDAGKANQNSRYLFEPAECGHSATFPRMPVVKESIHAGGIKSQVAILADKKSSSFMRAECMPTGGQFPLTKEFAISQITELSDKTGLQNTTINSFFRRQGIHASVRGVKKISGRWVTYKINMDFNKSSFIALTVGGPSEGYPQAGLFTFLESVKTAE